MKKAKKEASLPIVDRVRKSQENLVLADYAYQVINEQVKHLFKQKKPVLKDTRPEPLHQMRVASRRLRTALQVFGGAVKLPKSASAKKLRDLARVLGKVRDLDVQIASLKDYYCPQLDDSEQKQLQKVIAGLKQQRVNAFAKMESVLTSDRYADLKQSYEDWLEKPQYQAIAVLPIRTLLPDLLTPLLSELLLHPGWLVSTQQASGKQGVIVHDLRKVCKHVRYQSEFFTEFYGKDFPQWIKQIKGLQDNLGDFQDTQVLLQLLSEQAKKSDSMPQLQMAIQQKQTEAMSGWDQIRQDYLQSDFRYRLHQMLLQPTLLMSQDAIEDALALN
ncbi:MAG TPA: CHAD domain-containing protein [Coleofasciculaceae cyanobacterium]